MWEVKIYTCTGPHSEQAGEGGSERDNGNCLMTMMCTLIGCSLKTLQKAEFSIGPAKTAAGVGLVYTATTALVYTATPRSYWSFVRHVRVCSAV